jgi:hypothetical protein
MSVLAWVVRGPGGGAGPGNSALRGLLQTCGAGRGRDHLVMMTSCSAGRGGAGPGNSALRGLLQTCGAGRGGAGIIL